MVFHDLSLLAASPDACHASRKKAKIKAKTLIKKPSKIIEIASCWSLFQLLALDHPKNHQNDLTEPCPGASRGAKTAQRGAKSGPRAAKTAPRAPRAVLAAICRPTAGPQRPPGGHFGLLGARCSTLRGAIFEASAASSAAFREALSLASRPLESTAPEAKKARKCQNQEPANTSESRHVKKMRKQRPRQQRRSKQPLAPKRQANKRWSAVSRLRRITISGRTKPVVYYAGRLAALSA